MSTNSSQRTAYDLAAFNDAYLNDHDHLKAYRDFTKTAPVDTFVLFIVSQFDSDCYKKYLDLNMQILDRVWTQHINSNNLRNNFIMEDCGKTLSSCDTKHWNAFFSLYDTTDNMPDSDMMLYTHIDPDYFLLYDFSTIKWMQDCIQYGFSFRQMNNNFHVPWISLSHACFSHRLIRQVGPAVMKGYMEDYQDKQIALYAFVFNELFDGNFHHMLQHSMGSVYSERLGQKLEKPASCAQIPQEVDSLSSIHLGGCKGRNETDMECMLDKIRTVDNTRIRNYKLKNDIQSEELKKVGSWGNTPLLKSGQP